MSNIYAYPDLGLGFLEKHTQWEPPGGTGVYRRSLLLWRNFTARWTPCDLLIFLDGQNLFYASRNPRIPNWDGERRFSVWEQPLLIVGVPASKRRYAEYVGWSTEPGHYSESGDRHADFLVQSVLPYVKSAFPRSRLKALVGASAGGVAALYTGWNYPRVFPSIACLSAGRHYFSELLENFSGLPARQVYISCGDRGMDREFLPQNKDFVAVLKARKSGRVLNRWHRGSHSESVWSRRIPDLLKFTLGGPSRALP